MFYFFNAGKWSKASYLPGYCYLPQKISPYVASTKRIVYAFLSECQWKKNHKTKTKKNLLEFTALIFWWSVRQRHRNPQNLVCTYPLKYLEKYALVFEENFDMISLTFLWQCCNSQEDVTSGSLLFLLSISYHPTLLASLLLLSFVDLCFFKTFCFHLFENESGILQETLLKFFFFPTLLIFWSFPFGFTRKLGFCCNGDIQVTSPYLTELNHGLFSNRWWTGIKTNKSVLSFWPWKYQSVHQHACRSELLVLYIWEYFEI